MCQVPLEHQQPGQAVGCICIFTVTVVTGWALAHIVAVCWGAPQQVAEDFFMVRLGLALFIGVALVHL